MLLITNEELEPAIVDIINRPELQDLLLEATKEYIYGQAKKTIIANSPAKVFPVSGRAEYHHEKLRDYLNHLILQNFDVKSTLETGTFANFPMSHCWLRLGDIILDVTIKQFATKPINIPKPIQKDLNAYCFLSNNPDNFLYKLYQAN